MSSLRSRTTSRLPLILLAALGALAMTVACEEKKETPATQSATPAPLASTTTPATAATEGDTEQDFEDEAQSSVTADNLEAELAKLEAEIK